jgi:hypothetical protein
MTRSTVRLRHALLVLLALFALLPPQAAARQLTSVGATPYLPAGHWSYASVQRLHALGLAPRDLDPGLRSRTAGEVAGVLRHAVAASGEGTAQRRIAERSLERLYRELPGLAAYTTAESRSWGVGQIEVGAIGQRGAMQAGIGNLANDWTGPRPLDDHGSAAGRARLHGAIHPRLAGTLHVSASADGSHIPELHVATKWRGLAAWAGRRSPGYGGGAGGAILLSGSQPFTGAGLGLDRGQALPGLLEHLGPIRLEGFLSRADNRRKSPGGTDTLFTPWFAAARFSMSPGTARLNISATRAAFFGGEGNTAVTTRNLLVMIYGDHSGVEGEFDNQMFGMDVHYRPPLGRLPLLLRFEWAFDDNSGMLWRVPAVLWGIEVPALPGVEAVRIGVERAVFAGCFDCKNTRWYRNWFFREGWTDGGMPIGHPLGGHGREWMAFADFDLPATSMVVGGDVRFRDRRAENLFAPDWQGASRAAALRISWLPRGRWFMNAEGAVERGDSGWSTGAFEAFAGWRF